MNEGDALADRSKTDALAALWLDYDQSYEIEVTEHSEWRWRRLDGLGGWTAASGPDELRQQVWEDYDLKPVACPEPTAREPGPAARFSSLTVRLPRPYRSEQRGRLRRHDGAG